MAPVRQCVSLLWRAVLLLVAVLLAPLLAAGPASADPVPPPVPMQVVPVHLPPAGSSSVTADVLVHDDGTQLFTTGTATGMDPDRLYVSLWSGSGSRSTGATPCRPDGSLSTAQMLVGTWTGAETRTLVGAVQAGPANGLRLDETGTVSVRAVTPWQLRRLQAGLPVGPLGWPLQGCADVPATA